MNKYSVSKGIIPTPVKAVVYGPEGIGKTTLASRWPDPVFIDTEGGSLRLEVDRLPRPESWAVLLDEVQYILAHHDDYKTLVIDTADWAEVLAIRAVCQARKVSSIEDIGYGKGYVMVADEWSKLLNLLDQCQAAGMHIVVTAHAKMRKFEQPDESGAYDRWELKLTKQTAPMLKEWADMLLFANYKTTVIYDKDGKAKARGGERVLYASHHPCWDAKNRFGLPDWFEMDFDCIAHLFKGGAISPAEQLPETIPENPAPAPDPKPEKPAKAKAKPKKPVDPATLILEPVPDNLRQALIDSGITTYEIRQYAEGKGHFPATVEIAQYPQEYVLALLDNWKAVVSAVMTERHDLPF